MLDLAKLLCQDSAANLKISGLGENSSLIAFLKIIFYLLGDVLSVLQLDVN